MLAVSTTSQLTCHWLSTAQHPPHFSPQAKKYEKCSVLSYPSPLFLKLTENRGNGNHQKTCGAMCNWTFPPDCTTMWRPGGPLCPGREWWSECGPNGRVIESSERERWMMWSMRTSLAFHYKLVQLPQLEWWASASSHALFALIPPALLRPSGRKPGVWEPFSKMASAWQLCKKKKNR